MIYRLEILPSAMKEAEYGPYRSAGIDTRRDGMFALSRQCVRKG